MQVQRRGFELGDTVRIRTLVVAEFELGRLDSISRILDTPGHQAGRQAFVHDPVFLRTVDIGDNN